MRQNSGKITRLSIDKIQWANVEKAKVQDDPALFYTLVTSSFLESTANFYANNLATFFQNNSEVVSWLRQTWQLEELNHGTVMRMYIKSVWPEYDWDYAYSYFLKDYTSQRLVESFHSSRSLMMLNLCVTETEAALSYRAFANYVDDLILKRLMSLMYADEIRHYKFFLKYFFSYKESEKLGIIALAKTIMKRQKMVNHQDLGIPLKYIPLGWYSSSPFKQVTTQEVLYKVGQIMNQHFSYSIALKMLFKPLGSQTIEQRLTTTLLESILKRQVKAMLEN